MLTKTGMTIAALSFGVLTAPAIAQDAISSDQFSAPVEMASLDLGSQKPRSEAYVPVPMSRPEILEAAAPSVQPAQEIRRTASGIRIVGPRFFPAE